jgi:hypothetical protein
MLSSKRAFFGLVAVFMAAYIIGCGPKFPEGKGNAIEQVTPEQETTLKKFGAQQIKNLSPAEQQQVADIIWESLLKIKKVKMAKQMCHAASLAAGNGCSELREKCLKAIPADTEESATTKLKAEEANVKLGISAVLATAEYAGEDFIKMLHVVNDFLSEIAEKLDCDSSQEEKDRLAEERIAQAGGQQKFAKLMADFKQLVALFN